MRILILGGTGLLGVNWALMRREVDEVIVATNRRQIDISGVKTKQLRGSGLKELKQTIEETDPELVINCAALTDIEECENDPAKAYFVNAEFAGRVGKACFDCSVRLIHVSTDHLYRDGSHFKKESDAPSPVNVYGASKLAGEERVYESKTDALILRTSFFGWGPRYRHSFSDYIIGRLSDKKTVRLNRNVGFNPVECSRLVAAAHQLLVNGESGVINITADDRMTKYDFGVDLARQLRLDEELIVPVVQDDRRMVRPTELSLSNKLLQSRVGVRMGNMADQIELLVLDPQGIRREVAEL